MLINTIFKNPFTILKKIQKQLFLLCLLFITVLHANAQVPLNDEPCNGTAISAITLIPNAACGYQTFTNVDATNSSDNPTIPSPTCGNFIDADVWFTAVVPAGTTSMTIDTRQGLLQDGAMSIYTVTGTCPNLVFTLLACDDNSSNNALMPKLTINQPAGTRVYIRIWGFGGSIGTFGICATAPLPPANDECINAQLLTPSSNQNCVTQVAGTTALATQSTNTPNPPCGTFNGWNDDVWYKFTATSAAHTVTLSTVVTGTTAMVINVYSGTCTNLTQVGCVQGNVLTIGGLTTGTEYLVRVYTNLTGTTSATFNICVTTPPPPPANDECANAQNLITSTTPTCVTQTAGTTASSTQSSNGGIPTCGAANTFNDDVWYRFTATNPAHVISLSSIAGGTTAMVMVLYSGANCTSLTQIGCVQGNQLFVGGLIVNTQYYIRVYTNVPEANTFANFNICVTTPPPPPANDDCINSTLLDVNNNFACAQFTAGITQSATQSITIPLPTCGVANAYNDDVWYSFVATGTNHRVSVYNSSTTMAFNVYSGASCTSLTQIGCSASTAATNTLDLVGLTANTTYYVRVFTNSATNTLFGTFSICVGTPPPPPPNNDCINAISATVNPNYLCGIVTAGTTVSATLSSGVPTPTCSSDAAASDDVWFSFVATNPIHRISLLNIINPSDATTAPMTTVVYTGGCNTLTQVACNTTNLTFLTGLSAGTTYYVRVFTTTTNANLNVNFNFCVGAPPPPPANDNCAGAFTVPVNSGNTCNVVTSGSTAGATASTVPLPSCAAANTADDDLWYMFIATNQNHVVSLSSVSLGTTTVMAMAAYSGTCNNLTQIGCNTSAATPSNRFNMTGLTVGNTYFIRVFTNVINGDANFSLCITIPALGNICNTSNPAIACTGGNPTISITTDPTGLGTIGCLVSSPNPYWTSFNVVNPGNIYFQLTQTNTAGGQIDVDFAVWGPFATAEVGCNAIGQSPITLAPDTCSFSGSGNEFINITGATPGIYILLITNFNGGAGQFTLNQLPTTTTTGGGAGSSPISCCSASSNTPLCIGNNVSLIGTNLYPPTTAVTYSWTGPGYTSTAQNPPAFVSPTTVGNYTYNFVINVPAAAPCSTSTVVTVIAPITVGPTVITPITYCVGANPVPLTATPIVATYILTYYTTATGGTGVSTITPSTATVGSTTYYVSQKNGGCEGPRVPIVVNVVNSTTPAPTVTSPINYCQNGIATALTAGGTNLSWFTSATGGIGSSTAPIPLTTTAGLTTYFVSQTIGQCEGPRAAIVVNVTATSPLPTATTSINYCQGVPTVALTATGTNILWYTVATGGAGSTAAPTPSSAVVGPTTYYVTQNTTTCESNRLAIVVNVFANPTAPTVSSPVVYCQGTTSTALIATGTNVTWFTVPTGGTGSFTAPLPSTAIVGNTTYYVQSNNGTCFSARVPIIVVVDTTPPAPTVVSPVVYCQGTTATALTASGTNLSWYNTSTGGTALTAAPIPITAIVGGTSYYVSSKIGNCEGPRALIVVNVNETPAAPTVVTPVNYCQNTTAASLTNSVTSGTGLQWYTTSTGGTGSLIPPSITTSVSGSITYWVSSKIGNCEGPRSSIVVTVTAIPTAPVATPALVTYCINPLVAATALTASGATGNNLLWYNVSTGGSGASTAPIPLTTTAGNTLFYVTQSTANPIACESPRTTITVVVNPRPALPTVNTPLQYCQGVTAPALIATGTNLLWYTQPSGTGSNTAIVPSTTSVGSTNYFVSQSALNCEGAKATIVVNTIAKLTVDAGLDKTIARGDQTQLQALIAGAATNPSYLWTANVAPIALSATNISNPIANPIQTTTYTVKVTDPSNLCPAESDDVKITVVQSCINVRNAFTPNGDGINDFWLVYDQNFCLASNNGANVVVFNRYGSKVFESKSYDNKWDGTYNGKPLPDGTYFAVLEFKLFDGSKQYVRKDITILR